MSKEMGYVEVLAEDIGPRPATTEAEYQAAEWISEKFSHHRLTPETQTFNAPRSNGWVYVIYYLMIIAGAALSGLTGWLRPVGLILALAGAGLHFADLEMIWGFSRLFARHPSQNVIAKHQPRGNGSSRSRKIIIVAHYDTPRTALLAHNTPLIFTIAQWCTFAVPLLILIQMLIPALRPWSWYVTLVPAAILLVPLVLNLLSETIGKDTDGASNNASGVAAMLGVLGNVIPEEDDEEEETHAPASRDTFDTYAPHERTAAAPVRPTAQFGREKIEAAGIAPAEATIEYPGEARPRPREEVSAQETAAFTPAPPAPTPSATASAPQEKPVIPAVKPGEETGAIPKVKPAVPQRPVAPEVTPSEGPLTASIPSIDEISIPGTPSTTASNPAVPPVQPTQQPIREPHPTDAMFRPSTAPAPAPVQPIVPHVALPTEDDEWGADGMPPLASGATEDFEQLPDSRVRELGSQVTGMFQKIVPGRKKKTPKEDEEAALGSWLDGGGHTGKIEKVEGWDMEDDDDDEFGWQGGVTPVAGEDEHLLTTEERLARIRDEVLSVSDRDLLDKEVWFVALGAKESGAFGMQNFMDEYGEELRGALIINIDSIGAGELSWLTNEGMIRSHRADRRLIVLARRLSRNEGIAIRPARLKGITTDALAALAKGHSAMTIMGLDGPTPALYRSADDVASEVDPANIKDVVTLVTGMIRES